DRRVRCGGRFALLRRESARAGPRTQATGETGPLGSGRAVCGDPFDGLRARPFGRLAPSGVEGLRAKPRRTARGEPFGRLRAEPCRTARGELRRTARGGSPNPGDPPR
ncbi:MAG: hypothetical protein ACREJJ_06725, partial [Candidatus Methylomirabilales bacterium]